MRFKDPNHQYFTDHFADLVEKYAGNWVVIAGGEMIGICPKHQLSALIDQARQKYPDDIPLTAPIPKEEEIECIL